MRNFAVHALAVCGVAAISASLSPLIATAQPTDPGAEDLSVSCRSGDRVLSVHSDYVSYLDDSGVAQSEDEAIDTYLADSAWNANTGGQPLNLRVQARTSATYDGSKEGHRQLVVHLALHGKAWVVSDTVACASAVAPGTAGD
jgi:hypothetical protein